MSWSRKSENGKNVTSFSWGIEFDPVVNTGRWQLAQPICVNVTAPRLAWAVKGNCGGGASNVMNSVNCVRSLLSGSFGLLDAGLAASRAQFARRPWVGSWGQFSFGNKGVVMPISFK